MNGFPVERLQRKRVLRKEKMNQRFILSDHERNSRMRQAYPVSDCRAHELFTVLEQLNNNSLINSFFKVKEVNHFLDIMLFREHTIIKKGVLAEERVKSLDVIFTHLFMF